MSIAQIVENQRQFFSKGETLDVRYRIKKLVQLKAQIKQSEERIFAALKADFNKPEYESYSTEIGFAYHEINYFIKNLGRLVRPKLERSALACFPSRSYLIKQPYGVTLVMAPWNYPFLLAMSPLIGAVAAGNCVVLKPSNYSPQTSSVLKEILNAVFEPCMVEVVLGGREQNQQLLDQKFDYIFFTGGTTVGKLVMQSAAKNLTPLTLELGGKSPCFVDADANIDVAARRITWGKFLNGGQTCVAPDYILVHKSIKADFVKRVSHYIKEFYYSQGVLTEDFPAVISQNHFERLQGYLIEDKIVCGGNAIGRILEPTVMDNVSYSDAIMGEEIFGPIMPILEFEDFYSEAQRLRQMPKPLAFYYFGTDNKKIEFVCSQCEFGGGCINDVVMHLSNLNLPFGGVGASGMGRYHAKASIETFSHQKSMLKRGYKFDNPLRYPPYSQKNLDIVKKLLK